MNILDFSPYIALVLAAIALLTQLKGILSSGEKKLDERTKTVEVKLIEHDRRIQSVENEMKHLPDRDMAHRLELNLEKLSSQVATLNERVKPIAATNERMMELLMEAGKK
jgi:hypothetical protein